MLCKECGQEMPKIVCRVCGLPAPKENWVDLTGLERIYLCNEHQEGATFFQTSDRQWLYTRHETKLIG